MTVTDVAGETESEYENLKKCKQCAEDKPRDEFYDNHSASDGKFAKCKKCVGDNRKKKYAERNKITDVELSTLNRAQKFVKGILDTSELTDDELNGRFIYQDDDLSWGANPKIPFAKLDNRPGNRFEAKLNKELSKRINEYIKSKSLRAVQVIFEIADSDTVEPADRLKAATWLGERVIGKTPEVLLTGDVGKTYEDIFDTNIQSGSREDYRRRIQSGREEASEELLAIERDNKRSGIHSDSGRILDAEVEEGFEEEYEYATKEEIEAENGVVGYGDSGSGGNSDHSPENGMEGRDSSSRLLPNDDNSENTGIGDRSGSREEFRLRKAELAKARTKAKQRRFAARAMGFTSLERLPYALEFSLIKKGPLTGKLLCRLVCPDALSEARLAKLDATNALTDDALAILYPQLNELDDNDSGTPELDEETEDSETENGKEHDS